MKRCPTRLIIAAATAAKLLQSCPTLRPQRRQPTRLPRPWDSPGKNTGVGCYFLLRCMKVKVKLLSRVRLLVTPWTAAYQVPPSMGSSRQEYWSGVPLPSPLSHLVTSNFVTLWTVACQTPVSMRFFQARVLECGAIAFSNIRDFSNESALHIR